MMDSNQRHSLSALLVFENTMNKELVRSLHVYRFEGENEKHVEREFLFKKRGSYVEMVATPLFKVREFRVSEYFEGKVIGLWLCIFVFDADSPSSLNHIPPTLLVSSNTKLKSIPTLANDLKTIFQLSFQADEQRSSCYALEETGERDRDRRPHSTRSRPEFIQDLNCLPNSVEMCEYQANKFEKCAAGNMLRKRRAASEDVAKISLNDLVKYFDLPILEASRNLKVGLTVLKKKCREFGIPRWPHRKIKSLDSLIHELEDVVQQLKDDEAVVAVVTKRQKMLEEERETIERRPFVEIQKDTKKFRQDIFKRRHKARALKSQGTSSSTAGRSQFSEAVSEVVVEEANPDGQILESPNLKEFTFADLKAATKNFKPDTLLGEGGFGKVYKGWIDEKTLAPSKSGLGLSVAIKRLNPESMQGFEEWQSEVNFLGRLSHPNLVKLIGYCWEDKDLLLVYEHMQKGSLENHLFRRHPAIEPLSWDLRLKIAIGAARGLAFLHTSEKKVIYRDFKASNILLDGNYNAKISDFGLAKLGPAGGESHVTTRIMGTYGYAAPEYVATGHLYVKSDVYGFGVVLLEILTGLRALDTKRPNGQQNLVDWLKPTLSHKRKLKTIIDARMEGQYTAKAAYQAAQLTLKCLEADPKNRPSMKEVLEVLEQVEAMKEKPKNSKFTSPQSKTHHRPQPYVHHRSPLH